MPLASNGENRQRVERAGIDRENATRLVVASITAATAIFFVKSFRHSPARVSTIPRRWMTSG